MDQLHRMRKGDGGPVWVLVLMIVATACSSGGGQTATPDDFATTESELFSISHPAEWELLSQDEQSLKVAATGDEEVRPSAAVTVDQSYDSGVDGLDTAVTGTLTVMNNIRQNVQELDTEAPEIPGAEAVRMVESTFTTGDGADVHHIDLFAINQDGRLVYARAEAPQEQADPEMLRAIVSSLTLP